MLHLLKIPKDEDAKGIVVRTINHKYYLHLHTLRFIDPYIEVEYNLSQRRNNLRILSNICIFMIIFSIIVEIMNYLYLNNESIHMNHFYKSTFIVTHIFSIILGSIYLFIYFILRLRKFVYIVDWCSIAVIISLLWVVMYNFIINKIISLSLASYSESFMTKHFIGVHVLYFAKPLTSCIMNILFFYTMKNICTYPKLLFMSFIQSISIITINLLFNNSNWNTNHDIDVFMSSTSPHISINYETNTNNTFSFLETNDQNASSYLKTFYDIRYFLNYHFYLILTLWIIFITTTLVMSRNHEILSRENFILKRVKSDKDTRNIDDGGLVISSVSDLDVINENIKKVKMPSTESDPSNNKTPPILDIANNYLVHQNTYTIWNSNNENETQDINTKDNDSNYSNDKDISKNIEIEIGEKCDNFDSMTSLDCNSIISNNEINILQHAIKELVPISEEKYSRSESND